MRRHRKQGLRSGRLARALSTLAVPVALLVLAAPAEAAKVHPFGEILGAADQPSFDNPNKIAVDPASGDVLVVDQTGPLAGPSYIGRYQADGAPAPFSALGTHKIDGEKGPGGKPCVEEPASCDATPENGFDAGNVKSLGSYFLLQIAVDDSGTATDGNIYITQVGNSLVSIFGSDGRYLGQLKKAGTKNLLEPAGLAVDAAGTLFVADAAKDAIYKFAPSGAVPKNSDFASEIKTVKRPTNLATGTGPSAGALFVATGGASSGVAKLDAVTGTLQYSILSGLSGVGFGPAVATIAVSPATGNLLVVRSDTNAVAEYDASGASSATLLSSTAMSTLSLEGAGSVIATAGDSSGNVYVDYKGNQIAVLSPPIITVPDVVTDPATDITPSRATLHGTVNPDGVALTECAFEYGTSTNPYPQVVPCAESLASIGSGTAPVPVHADVSGLPANSSDDVNFRLVAKNANEAQIGGANRNFFTAFSAITKPATSITGAGAVLNGEVNPDGTAVSACAFEYKIGTDSFSPYEGTVPCAESSAEIGTGSSPVPVHAALTGLANGIVYTFRLVATNGLGPDQGNGQTFSTLKTVTTEPASAIGATSATLNGTVDPQGEALAECFFEYGTTIAYGGTVPCAESSAEIGSGTGAVPVHADVTGLAVGTSHHFRLVAVNGGGPAAGADVDFRTLGSTIDSQWAARVANTEARLRAAINPQGSATTYHLEYGEVGAPSFEHSTAESASIGSDSSNHTVSVDISSLEPGTTYRYRFVAAGNCDPGAPSEACVTVGPELTFTTFAPTLPRRTDCANQEFRTGASAALPDCRAYEMVSPVDKNGANVAALNPQPAALDLASEEGDRVTFSTFQAFGDPVSAPWSSQYIVDREPGQGWNSRNISPVQEGGDQLETGGLDVAYKGFTEDLCHGWVLKGTEPLLTSDAVAGFTNIYRHDNCGGGGFSTVTTGTPTEVKRGFTEDYFIPFYNGASADGSRSIFSVRGKLTPEASTVEQVYLSSPSGLHFVCYLPSGVPSTQSCEGGSGNGGVLPFRNQIHKHAISADGSRVYWRQAQEIYLRENPDKSQSAVAAGECTEAGMGCTIEVSTAPGSRFWGATADGGKALYTTSSPAYPTESELFLFDAEADPPASTPIADGTIGVLGFSDDASRVYFASREVLAGPNPRGQEPDPARWNVYLYEDQPGGPGEYTFVATLTNTQEFGTQPFIHSPYAHSARVSPDGQHLAFVSNGRFTGYDNTDQASGTDAIEVFLFDAEGNSGAGALRCVSCNPSGARPMGRDFRLNGELPEQVAADIPGWPSGSHASRVLSADGDHLFFNSFEGLVPTDTNGARDVYVWQRGESQADCEAVGAEMHLIREGGCLSLISSGESPADSSFVDASADGRDVFFRTTSSLLPQDPGLQDIYDARVAGGFAPPPASPAACEGEACQGPYDPPEDPSPASSTYQGAGNVVEDRTARPRCGKGKARKKGRCVKKRTKKSAKQRANSNRRTSR